MRLKILLHTTFALLAFAANSVLCRLALGGAAIDAGSFTAIRLLSGVVVLLVILGVKGGKESPRDHGGWMPALMLFTYAAGFSFAYASLDTGTGALILFGAVQMTMILAGVFTGKKLHFLEWLGVLFAHELLSPGLVLASAMILGGIAVVMLGQKQKSPSR